MFLYDKYRSGGMAWEQFKARTGVREVKIEEIGNEVVWKAGDMFGREENL